MTNETTLTKRLLDQIAVRAMQGSATTVSYEDMANPRRVGYAVEYRSGQYRVQWEDGDETWSDLRQHGWRIEVGA